MRMWMVDPSIMCQKHLCGEHVEMHMFLSHLRVGKRVNGYVKNNCLEMKSLYQRHQDISNEMFKRGYNHASLIDKSQCDFLHLYPEHIRDAKVDRESSLKDLLGRCDVCYQNYYKLKRYEIMENNIVESEIGKLVKIDDVQKDLKTVMSFVPDWLFKDIPKNIDPTFYITGTYVGDTELKRKIEMIIKNYELIP